LTVRITVAIRLTGTVKSANGVAATAHYLATAAGVGMLSLGGSAVDVAVAASLAIGVCEPAGSGLGGMSLMLIHLAASNRTFTALTLTGIAPPLLTKTDPPKFEAIVIG